MTRSSVVFASFLALVVYAAQRPTQSFSTYIGLADCDGIAVRKSDIFLACHSTQNQLPIEVKGSLHKDRVGDAYVVRLNFKSGRLIYATRIGGSAYSATFRIKVDQHGFAYAVGVTRSKDFHTTPGAVQRKFGGGESDAFLVKIAPNGELVYATLLGGDGADEGNGLELDGKGGVFVAGTTWSTDFPGQETAHQAARGDAFVSYVQPEGPTSFHSVIFGGSQEEKLTGIALDGRGGLFAVGYTKSNDFPAVDPVQTELRGVSDLFLARLETRRLKLTFSTFFGGSGDDSGWGVAVDRQGNPVVAGITNSKDLPTSKDAFQRVGQGERDAFVAKFDGPRFHDVNATYFGGSKDDFSGSDGDDIKIDSAGNVWFVGSTVSRDLPTRHALQPGPGSGGTNGFLTAFSPRLTSLCYSTYYGGAEGEQLEGLDVSKDGNVLATGFSFSKELPLEALVDRTKPSDKLNGSEVHTIVHGLRATRPCL